ncbi:ileal sodium/bile acid cotransporter-like [Elysia marginata]|uniref:Ileal sodium/bile acid cotransporter-like n=1 Tax=Elysia marginata TaxID=1093978 RepID=A0AAV4HRJ4_9GAST|nr:ileal sodium/bile acid cotransporter-like [Elysia marginata]
MSHSLLTRNFIFIVLIVTTFNIDIVASQAPITDQENPTKPSASASVSSGLPIVKAMAVPNMGRPGVLFYNLMSTNEAEIRFSVKCEARTTMYELSVFTSNTRVASIQGESSFNVSCANASKVEENKITDVHNIQETAPQQNITSSGVESSADLASSLVEYALPINTGHQAMGSGFVGQIKGRFNVTLEAKNIGRSFFVITARRLSGPEPDMRSFSSGSDARTDANTEVRGNSANPAEPEMPGSRRQLHKDQVGLAMVVVMQLPRTIDTVFRIVLRCVIVMATAGMGLKVDIQVVKQVLKKPIGPVIGFCCQFICMPLVSTYIEVLLHICYNAISSVKTEILRKGVK